MVIVGAGVAGLSCAAAAAAGGRPAVVFDKGRGVGGRCATRRIDGQPVDHGLAFYHGTDAGFHAALLAASDGAIDGWPFRVTGRGAPCAAGSLGPRHRRVAFADGATTFPKALARGLDIRSGVRIAAIEPRGDGFDAIADDGTRHGARDLVLAVPAAQALALLRPLTGRGSEDLDAAAYLLETMASSRCLTAIALYDRADPPPWDLCLPEDSPALQVISHDSAKRRDASRLALVLQARHAWSVAHWDDAPERWCAALLDEAARLVGAWAAAPDRTDTMRWRHARPGGPDEVAGPMLCGRPASGRIGLAGECFHPAGGVEAAWLSGRTLARRLIDERNAA